MAIERCMWSNFNLIPMIPGNGIFCLLMFFFSRVIDDEPVKPPLNDILAKFNVSVYLNELMQLFTCYLLNLTANSDWKKCATPHETRNRSFSQSVQKFTKRNIVDKYRLFVCINRVFCNFFAIFRTKSQNLMENNDSIFLWGWIVDYLGVFAAH